MDTDVCGGAIALGMGAVFDISSIIGHVCYLHGISTKGGILPIMWRILAKIVRRRSDLLADAMEEAGMEMEVKDESE